MLLKQAVTKTAVADNLEDAFRLWEIVPVAGVLTDLHFPEKSGRGQGPCGLARIIRAALKKIPVSICSDIDHHHADYLRSVVKDLEQIGNSRIPFTMDCKDWERAWKNLKKIMEEE